MSKWSRIVVGLGWFDGRRSDCARLTPKRMSKTNLLWIYWIYCTRARTHANTHSSREIISLFCLSILFWSGSLSYSFFARVMFLRVVSFLLLFARPQKIKSKIENANLHEIYGRNCSIFCHDKLAHSRQIEPIAGMIEWMNERKKEITGAHEIEKWDNEKKHTKQANIRRTKKCVIQCWIGAAVAAAAVNVVVFCC